MNEPTPKVDFSKGVSQCFDRYPETKYRFILTVMGKWGVRPENIHTNPTYIV